MHLYQRKSFTWLVYLAFSVPTVFLAMWIEFQNCPRGLLQIEIPLILIPAVALGFLCGRARAKKVFLRGCVLHFFSSCVCLAGVVLAQVSCSRHNNLFDGHFKPARTALGMLVFLSVIAIYVTWVGFLLGGGEKEPSEPAKSV